MTGWDVLPRAFYDRNPVTVAQALLGKQLVREADDGLVTGIIVETEAYLAADDPASHAYSKRRQCYRRTPRCAPMFGPPGHAYIYRSYGLHYCCNLVTEGEGVPSAVLLRAIRPKRGLDAIQRRRGTDRLATLAHGPGNLCRAFAIDLALNGWDVTQGQRLWVAAPASASVLQITRSRRIGVADDLALRFAVVSRWSGPIGRRANGVLDSTTNFIEHPELVAQRLVRYAEVVGKENVIAGSDCGFATCARTTFQVEPEIVWAKLRAMAEGA